MSLLLRQILLPVSRRLGTLVGSYLTALNVPADDTATVVAAIPILVGVLVDLLHSNVAQLKGWK